MPWSDTVWTLTLESKPEDAAWEAARGLENDVAKRDDWGETAFASSYFWWIGSCALMGFSALPLRMVSAQLFPYCVGMAIEEEKGE